MTDRTSPILHVGQNCWKVARAGRVSVIIDAADYFATVRAAIREARHSVFLVGWDFDTRVPLDRPNDGSGVPNTLGKFLKWVVAQRPELRIYVLRWNWGAINELGRGTTPLTILNWMTDDRIQFRLDAAHPVGSAHHQKIVVIDDALAFCGGIDITADRWDTREHLDHNPERVRPTTKRPYGPWHDVTTAVDGDAARALGNIARQRWKRATGEDLEPPPHMDSTWPAMLAPSFRNVDVAISRTVPEYGEQPGIHEIEALYLAAIAAAECTIYIENQYFASRKIAKAMAARLREPGGPEIVLITPESAEGWLEEKVMGSSRTGLLRLVDESDLNHRFRPYTPVTAGHRPIYVHAKVLVVDDRLVKVGSSNVNNRSLGFDTECDLSVEAVRGAPDAHDVSEAIIGLRNDLLAEHLGVGQAVLDNALGRAEGSLIGAIEMLRSNGRSLVPFEPPDVSVIDEALLQENQLLDPERPSRRWHHMRRALSSLNPLS